MFKPLKKVLKLVISCAAFVLFVGGADAQAASRIKDITSFEGVRDNLLIGYGIVVGLSGTGDKIDSNTYTKESLIGMLERLGVNSRDGELGAKNVAAVMVTATLPPFSRQGSRIDVNVSALGDASSLQGGLLLVTPLLGADGAVYAVAQGQLQIGGYSAQGNAETVQKGVPTSGRIPSGAIVETEIPFNLQEMKTVQISLRNPDFTTSTRIANAINTYIGTEAARAIDSGTVDLVVPKNYPNGIVGLLTDVEQLRVDPDQLARVVIDESTGVIVIGENVRIDKVAIAQGNLTIRVTETPQVSQPAPFSQTGTTQTVDRTNIEVDEDADKKLTVVDTGVNLQDLVNGLNALGVGPRDMISILQAVKAAGALQAEIDVM
jgi:flagellar P-ring protein precursor FlgI